ncbi:PREDICTED: growth-regulating factor 5-like [Tarenaya hassleriana]|uniref:growth-regulating factor 5-like n=1 Tax=Tarenaya hassleriana TaxID=28532 RepID=UPI00053C741D|nr:PREDICTED: growth-regulating factor 5-like [Tarenaya hassleriana]XP_010552236.1 PREDICTED: growth-regulating factor 5-like [Tarenaya hassleriana]
MMGLTSGSGDGRSEMYPFTTTQWQELEQQALVYKYMVSGVPVPPELIFSIRRSLHSSFSSPLLPHQPFGWGCFQMGLGRKPDTEPGRCRRTDGKKWRCSRESHPNSKYCEKHMHRGRNRTRKSLENPAPLTSLTSSSSSVDGYSIISAHQPSPRFSGNSSRSCLSHSLNYHYPSSWIDSGLSLQNSSSHQLNVLGSAGACSQTDKDFSFRYLHGTMEGVGERSFFPEASRSFQDSPYHQPLTMMSRHCFELGTDMFDKTTGTVPKESKPHEQDQDQDQGQEQEHKKPLHHFFGEDWPPTTKNSSDSWLDLSSNSRIDDNAWSDPNLIRRET